MKNKNHGLLLLTFLSVFLLSLPVKAESLPSQSAQHPLPPTANENASEAVAEPSTVPTETAAEIVPEEDSVKNEEAVEITEESGDLQKVAKEEEPAEGAPEAVSDGEKVPEKDKPEKEYTSVPFDIGLFPTANVNEAFDGSILNHVSLGVFGTKQDKLKGFGASLFYNRQNDEMVGMNITYGLNLSLEDTKGFQAAALMNYTGDDLTGVQAAALYNHAGGDTKGVQVSAIANATVGSFSGAQLALITSVTVGEFKGLQLGMASVAVEDFTGVQAGLGTYAKNLRGGQLGLLNLQNGESFSGFQWGLVDIGITEKANGFQAGLFNLTVGNEYRGVQAGLANVATGKVRGAQIGLFNYAEEADAPIGLISIVKNGMLHGNFWTSDTALVNVGLKFGGKYVYNILAAGFQPSTDSMTMSLGWGIGGHAPLSEKWFLDSDVMIFRQSRASDFENYGVVNKLRVMAGWQLSDDVALLFGPTLNVVVTETKNIDAGDVSYIPTFKKERFDENRRELGVMPGFMVGIQI